MALAGLPRPSPARNNLTQELFQTLPSSCLQRLLGKNDTHLAREMNGTGCGEKNPKVMHLKISKPLGAHLPLIYTAAPRWPKLWGPGSGGGPCPPGGPDTHSPNTLRGPGGGTPATAAALGTFPAPAGHPRPEVPAPPPDPRVRQAEGPPGAALTRWPARRGRNTAPGLRSSARPRAAPSGCGRAVTEGAGRRPEERSATARTVRAEGAAFLGVSGRGLSPGQPESV